MHIAKWIPTPSVIFPRLRDVSYILDQQPATLLVVVIIVVDTILLVRLY